MKSFFIFLFLVLYKPQFSPAQIDSIQPPEKEIILVTKLLDSLPYFLKTGKAYLIKKPECKLPGHSSYIISDGKNNFSFSEEATEITGSRRQEYIIMYAYFHACEELFNKESGYIRIKTLMHVALNQAIKNNFVFDELHGIRKLLNHLAFLQGDYAEAMKVSTEALAKAEKIKDQFLMAHYNNVLGYIMMKQKNYELSEKYYSTELDLAKTLKDKNEEAKALLNLADNYIAQQKKLFRSMALIREAKEIYHGEISSDPENISPIYRNAYCNNKLADVYRLMQRFDSALRYCLLAVKASPRPDSGYYGNLYDVANYYINAGSIYNSLQKPDSALFYLRTGLAIADSIDHSENKRDSYEQMSIAFAMRKKFDSAYIYQQNYRTLNDSILDVTARQNIAFVQSQFDTEKKDRQIKEQEARLKRQSLIRNIIIGSSIGLLLLGTLLYNSYRLKQKNKFQEQLNKQQNELMNTVIAVQDKERKRIAEDLHDTLGSILSAAKLKLSAEISNGNEHNYNDTLNLLDEAVNEMRNISHNLLPASLLRLGLIAGLQNLFDKISSKTRLQINFIAHGFKKRIDEIVEVSIYRIVLEAINNIVKHAQAKNVTVQLMQYGAYINVLVEDDGVGFDKDLVSKEQGIGLNNIYSRVDYMKGKVDIDTKPKGGTVINIDIPYRQE